MGEFRSAAVVSDSEIERRNFTARQSGQIPFKAGERVRNRLETVHRGITNPLADVMSEEPNVCSNIKNAVTVVQFHTVPVIDVISQKLARQQIEFGPGPSMKHCSIRQPELFEFHFSPHQKTFSLPNQIPQLQIPEYRGIDRAASAVNLSPLSFRQHTAMPRGIFAVEYGKPIFSVPLQTAELRDK